MWRHRSRRRNRGESAWGWHAWHGHPSSHCGQDRCRSRWRWRSICEQLVWPVCLGERVLCSQQSLCSRAMALSFRIFLEGVRHCDGPVAQILAIHGLNGGIRCIKAGEIDESVTLGVAGVWVSHDLWRLQDYTKGTKCVIEQFLINLWIQVTDEDVGTNIQVFVVG